jgi:hypothetical protein
MNITIQDVNCEISYKKNLAKTLQTRVWRALHFGSTEILVTGNLKEYGASAAAFLGVHFRKALL